jgi:hypothetical protein
MQIGKARTVTDKLINVNVTGQFRSFDNKIVGYSIRIKLPDCDDYFLGSIIKARYLKQTILKGQEWYLESGKYKSKENRDYLTIKNVITMYLDLDNIDITNEIPSFYNKSIFEYTADEIQDLATAFGLSLVPATGHLNKLRDSMFREYITKILGRELKEMPFYKFDNIRRNFYFDLTPELKNKFIIRSRSNPEETKLSPEDDQTNKQKTVDIDKLLDDFQNVNQPSGNHSGNRSDNSNDRKKLIEQAESLNIQFQNNISNRNLKKLIDEKLKNDFSANLGNVNNGNGNDNGDDNNNDDDNDEADAPLDSNNSNSEFKIIDGDTGESIRANVIQ